MGGAPGVPAMKLRWTPASRQTGSPLPGSRITVRLARRASGSGVPAKSPLALWVAVTRALSPWSPDFGVVDREALVVQVARGVAAHPGGLGQGEAQRADAHEVVGQHRSEGGRVAGLLGFGPPGQELTDVGIGGHDVTSLLGDRRDDVAAEVLDAGPGVVPVDPADDGLDAGGGQAPQLFDQRGAGRPPSSGAKA